MKIGFVLYDYFPFGGLQEDCLGAACTMRDRGHEVHVFTRTWNGRMPAGVEVHLLGCVGLTNASRNLRFFEVLEEAIREHRPDLVAAFNRVPDCDAYFSADPCYVERTRDRAPWRRLIPRHWHHKRCERFLFRDTKRPKVFCLTQREVDAYKKHYGAPDEKFVLLPPGIEPVTRNEAQRSENREALRREFKIPEGRKIALFVSSNFALKGLDRVLEALEAASAEHDLELWTLGNDDPGKRLHSTTQSSLKVRFMGGRGDISRFYDTADVLLHPSKWESGGKVLLEALAHGLPVITTDTCGYADHVARSGGGIVLPSPFSQTRFNETVREIIADGDRRGELAGRARRYAEKEDLYSCHETFAAHLEALFEEREGTK